jgi:hypothetical protein
LDRDIYLFYYGLAAFAIVLGKRHLGSPLILMEVVRLGFFSRQNFVKIQCVLTKTSWRVNFSRAHGAHPLEILAKI